MTDREKAIETLSIIKAYEIDNSIRGAEYREAIDMAIKALEQEPCDDAISRSDAIRIASGYCHWTNIPKELEKLPSVSTENPNKSEIKQKCDRINSLASVLPYAPHREIQELLCEIMDMCNGESEDKK